jgi:hypothetical protein
VIIGSTCASALAGDTAFTYYVGKGEEGKTNITVGLKIRSSDEEIKKASVEVRQAKCDRGRSGIYSALWNDGRVGNDGRFESRSRDDDFLVAGRILEPLAKGRARVKWEHPPIPEIGYPGLKCNSGKIRWTGEEVTRQEWENKIG